MKFSTTVTAASLLLSTNAPSIAFAFAPTQSYTTATTQRVQSSSSRLSLLPPVDPSSSIVISSGGDLVEALGQLALLGSVGFGVAMGNINNPDWSYEYKVGNEYSNSDLAMIGESDTSVLEKVEEETKEPEPVPEPVNASPPPAAVVEEPMKKEPELVPVVTAEPGKATIPSKELLESTEKAKAEVQKKGIQETKDKISSKSSAATKDVATTTPPVQEKKKESTEVAKTTKKSGGKRRIAKGVTLIVAAGAVALARNVVKAYLGRTIL